MATTSRTSTILTVATIAVGGLAAYAIYFDYKRRTDGNFRRKLRKDKKRIVKSQASSETSKTGADETEANDLRGALEKVRAEEMPTNPEEREKYFMAQVSIGEQLCAQGPVYNLPAAMCFYRAFRVYPSPVELIVIYQKTVPEPVFKLFMEMTNLDVSPSSSPEGRSQALHDLDEERETSPLRGGPPSETSSQDWDKVTDPGSQTPAT